MSTTCTIIGRLVDGDGDWQLKARYVLGLHWCTTGPVRDSYECRRWAIESRPLVAEDCFGRDNIKPLELSESKSDRWMVFTTQHDVEGQAWNMQPTYSVKPKISRVVGMDQAHHSRRSFPMRSAQVVPTSALGVVRVRTTC